MTFVKLDGKIWCLHDKYWNGEYYEAWECDYEGEYGATKNGDVRNIKPIYKEVADDEFELVGYEFVY